MPRRKYTLPAPLRDHVAALLRRGLFNREVMLRSGASLAYVCRIRKRIGRITLRRWTPEEDTLLQTSSVAKVAKRTGRTEAAVDVPSLISAKAIASGWETYRRL
jgi:hypothetical protein